MALLGALDAACLAAVCSGVCAAVQLRDRLTRPRLGWRAEEINFLFGEDAGITAPVVEVDRATVIVEVTPETAMAPVDRSKG